jgi:hypothetical protein
VDKKALSERDICTKFISPAIERAGWDMQTQLREEVYITHGRIMVRGRMTKRAPGKRVDYILFYKPNIPIAIVFVLIGLSPFPIAPAAAPPPSAASPLHSLHGNSIL